MRKLINLNSSLVLSGLFCMVIGLGFFKEVQSVYAVDSLSTPELKKNFSRQEIEKLVIPIALYPDLLLQQVLAASTFPEQILDAALFNEQSKDPKTISTQPWDESVKAIANYPSLITKMAGEIDWTLNLASAFVNQNVELRDVIQDLRAKAKKAGNLKSSTEQHVSVEESPSGNTVIIIEQAQPDVVYVPAQTTSIVYQEPVSTTSAWVPLASFGVGMALGYAMGDDDDDHYYGGYYGPGFWNRSDSVDNWVDYRNDRWNDAYDFANDRQDFRQDSRDDWREYRQDLGRQRQDYLKEKGKHPEQFSPEKRAEARSKATEAQSNWQNKKGSFSKSRSTGAEYSNQQASQRLQEARSNPEQANQRLQQARNNPQVQNRASQIRSNPGFQQRDFSSYSHSDRFGQRGSGQSSVRSGGAGFSGYSSGSRATSMAQNRGASSRSGSFGGGGAMRSGGGMRGGGGGRR